MALKYLRAAVILTAIRLSCPLPPAAAIPPSVSMNLPVLGTAYKWHHTAFVLLRLACFSEHRVLQVCPRGARVGMPFPCMDGLYSLSPPSSGGLFPASPGGRRDAGWPFPLLAQRPGPSTHPVMVCGFGKF